MISKCYVPISKDGKEMAERGSSAFPIAIYNDDLRAFPVLWHWHDELEAAVVLEGKVHAVIGSEETVLNKGDGFFVTSGVLHSMDASSDDPCTLHSMVFHPRLIGGGAESVFHKEYIAPLTSAGEGGCFMLRSDVPWQNLVLGCIERAWRACVDEIGCYEIICRNELSTAIGQLRLNAVKDVKTSTSLQRDDERIKKMLQFVHSSFRYNISVEDIAESAAISGSECLRCFRRILGRTPIQYLREYRIDEASRLIASSDASISAIAALVGFDDTSYFAKTFRQMKGCTPREYRTRISKSST